MLEEVGNVGITIEIHVQFVALVDYAFDALLEARFAFRNGAHAVNDPVGRVRELGHIRAHLNGITDTRKGNIELIDRISFCS